jgi:hypothetical protein
MIALNLPPLHGLGYCVADDITQLHARDRWPMRPGFTTYCNRRGDLLRSALATWCRMAREAVGENGS